MDNNLEQDAYDCLILVYEMYWNFRKKFRTILYEK